MIFLGIGIKIEDLKNIDFILPVENLEDINFIKKNLSNLEEISLENLLKIMKLKNSAILILRHNNKKLNVFLKTNFKGLKNRKIRF